ncbi:expressed unknown protein [Ectocarpus siliculosus]|uniref:Uncharacterized protein n=1 Tax=Ectocarpus siliculosus TaxID=2880 RepID=D7FJ51_ECTSI|nr:expressed unknown protein [Ectocarpus siliculosus]|eukprot:CBJ28961.1 expressed unknown protein [Ectocarpus siliculosus]
MISEKVVLNWFWGDVQRELSVGGGVVQPARTWGLHAACLLVKELEVESNPTQYSEVQDMVRYLSGVTELLEAHFLGSWTPPEVHGSKRSSSSPSSSGGLLKEGQAVSAQVPGLASVLAKLLCTVLPALQALQPSRELVRRMTAMWGVLRHHDDSRVKLGCLEVVELLAMFAPGDIPDALPEIMPFVQGVLRDGVGGTSPECLSRAAMCVKLIAARTSGAVESYRPELELYSCLESVLGSLTWEGAPTWRGVVVSRDVEKHFGGRVEAARQLEVAIDTVATVDQDDYRPLHWLLFGKALVVGTGHVQHPLSPRRGSHPASAAGMGGGGGGGEDEEEHGEDGRSDFGKRSNAANRNSWSEVVQGARNGLARFASPLASSRWQVKRTAVRGCVMVLSALQNGSSQAADERVGCLDVNKARRVVTRAVRMLPAEFNGKDGAGPSCESAALTAPQRPFWAQVPALLCLYLEDLVTLACAAATASTDDSELLELQEAGVMMLTEVARTFAQVPDSDEDELGLVVVLGKSVRAPTLALELSISQITGAARPALGCKVSPRLAQRGCELVVTLVREDQAGSLSQAEAEALRLKEAVEASYRPAVSAVYGMHVPLAERAARLQCLAALRLVAGGEDEASFGGGSGSGAVIPDSVRRGLMDALKEHLKVLGLHWLANVKDAVRLNQGDACGLWPRAGKLNIGAGLTYPPGVKPSLAKGPLKGRWPVMAAAAAAELAREGGGDDAEAAPFLLSVCVCGLLAAEEGLVRRRLGGTSRRHGRSFLGSPGNEFANGSRGVTGGGSLAGGGDNDEDEEEQDEGLMAEDASLMFLTAIRCLFSRPELLGSPSPTDNSKTPSIQEIGPENGAGMGEVDVGSPSESPDSGSAIGVPVSMVVRAVRTLSSPPFLQRVGDSEAGSVKEGRRDEDDKCPLRLQLAAISALGELLSSKGGEYVMRATAATTAAGRDGNSKTQEAEEEAGESDAEPFALWEALMGGVVGGVNANIPAAFDLPLPPGEETGNTEPNSLSAASSTPAQIGGATFTAEFPSDDSRSNGAPGMVSNPPVSAGADGAAANAAAKAFAAEVDKSKSSSAGEEATVMVSAALLPLLARLVPLCPLPRLSSTLPSLLLLSVRLLGAESGRVLGVAAGSAAAAGMGSATGGGGGGDAAKGLSSTPEAKAAVDFVRSSVREVWRHGNVQQRQEAGPGEVARAPGPPQGDVEGAEAVVSAGRGAAVPETGSVSTAPGPDEGAEIVEGSGVVANDEDGDNDDDDWGDDDFQGAEGDFQGAEGELQEGSSPPAAEAAAKSGEVGVRSDECSGEGKEESETWQEEAPVVQHKDDAPSSNKDGEEDGYASAAEDGADRSAHNDTEDETEGEANEAKEVLQEPADPDDVGNDEGSQETSAAADAPVASAAAAAAAAATTRAESADAPACVDSQDDGATTPENGSTEDVPVASPPPAVPDALNLLLGAGRAVNGLLAFLLGGEGATTERAAAIGAAAEAWGAVALTIPQEADGLAGPLREALTSSTEKCSVSTRLALLHAVIVTVKAAAGEDDGAAAGQAEADGGAYRKAAATALMRLLAPHALAGLRLEVDRAAAVAAAAGGGNVGGVADEEPREACLLEGVHLAQLAFKAAPQASHGPLLGLLLPLYASALALNLPMLGATIGQALLLVARSSAGAFKEAVAYVATGERQALEGAVRAAMMGRGAPVAGGDAGGRGGGSGSRMSGRKLDLSQYSTRG